MNRIKYIHPDFKEMLGIVPSEVGREIDLSFDIAARIHEVLVRKGWSQADFARNAGKKEAEISKKHAGFIVNKGNAKAKDVLKLISKIKRKVRKHSKLIFEEEIVVFNKKRYGYFWRFPHTHAL